MTAASIGAENTQLQAVDSDSAFLLRASRLAGLSSERDKSRQALLGKEVIIQQVDSKDMTVQAGKPMH